MQIDLKEWDDFCLIDMIADEVSIKTTFTL